MGARGPCPQRFPGAVVGKSRTTGSCYRTSVSSTIAKGSPGAGHCWHHRHRLSSQAPAWGWGRRGGGGSGMTRGRDARPGKLQKIGKKKKKIHPSSQKAPYAASADSPREDAWLNQGEMPPPWIQEGTRRGGLSHPARDGHHGGHGLAKMPPRAGTPHWDGHPPQWHPQMGSVGHPSITPAISGWFPLSHPRQHPSLPAPPTLLKPPPQHRCSSVPNPGAALSTFSHIGTTHNCSKATNKSKNVLVPKRARRRR